MTTLKKLCNEVISAGEGATGGRWYVAEASHANYTQQFVRSSDGDTDHAVCEAFGGTGPRPEDAAYIVTAANNADKMARALLVMEEALEELKPWFISAIGDCDCHEKKRACEAEHENASDCLTSVELSLARVSAIFEKGE